MSRATPFDLVFGGLAEERFPAIRDSLARSGADPSDRDQFVLDAQAAGLLRELVPDEGEDTAVNEHLALLHQGYLFWAAGRHTQSIGRADLTALLSVEYGPGGRVPGARYIQFPERLVWAETEPAAPHEPLDGVFLHPWQGEGLAVLAVFGFHPSRMGFSVVAAEGRRPERLARTDGSALFAPVLPGGAQAGLFSITGPEELLELAARAALFCPEPGKEPAAR
ncbi:MAG TPA: hypothetical protein VMJ30_08175 [Gemmatimonadales bacterium]|nr:hypothetical protein [Gemmatimonadales bacterium]